MSYFGGTRLTELSMWTVLVGLYLAGMGTPLLMILGYSHLALIIFITGMVMYLQGWLIPWRQEKK